MSSTNTMHLDAYLLVERHTDRQTDGRKSRTQKSNVAAVRSGGFGFSARTKVPTRWMNWGNMLVTMHCQLQFLNTVGHFIWWNHLQLVMLQHSNQQFQQKSSWHKNMSSILILSRHFLIICPTHSSCPFSDLHLYGQHPIIFCAAVSQPLVRLSLRVFEHSKVKLFGCSWSKLMQFCWSTLQCFMCLHISKLHKYPASLGRYLD
jgi:hypothetical protein